MMLNNPRVGVFMQHVKTKHWKKRCREKKRKSRPLVSYPGFRFTVSCLHIPFYGTAQFFICGIMISSVFERVTSATCQQKLFQISSSSKRTRWSKIFRLVWFCDAHLSCHTLTTSAHSSTVKLCNPKHMSAKSQGFNVSFQPAARCTHTTFNAHELLTWDSSQGKLRPRATK